MTAALASPRPFRAARHRPRRLREGDRVALVSPAGPAPSDDIDLAVALLRTWGLDPVLGAHARSVDARARYLAGSDVDRAADLRWAWLEPSITAVFCLRGGYGSMRTLDLLDFDELREAPPKLLVGSSDITALHQAWRHWLDVETLFAPMVATDAVLRDPVAAALLRSALLDAAPPRTVVGRSARTMLAGSASGPLTGGNVTLLAASIGAPEFVLPTGGIGLIEEVHEEPYRLDLLLLELKRSGWFDSLGAIALGSWEDCGDPREVEDLLAEYVLPLGIPAIWQLGFGHCAGAVSIPLGVDAHLVGDDGVPRIELTEAGDAEHVSRTIDHRAPQYRADQTTRKGNH